MTNQEKAVLDHFHDIIITAREIQVIFSRELIGLIRFA